MIEAELEEEREALLKRLRDLDEEFAAGGLDETDYRNLRDDYTARAADVLRQLSAGAEAGVTDTAAPASDDHPRRKVVGAAGTGGTSGRRASRGKSLVALALLAVVAAGAGFSLAGSSGERGANDEATGSLPEGSIDRITKAQLLVSDGKILEAVRVYDDLLRDDPENPVALAQRGWLLSRVDPSLVDSGLASIDRAIAIEPSYFEAHFFRGMILWRAKAEPAMAVEAFQRALEAKPPADVVASIEEVKAQAEAEARGEPPPEASGEATP